METNNKQYEKHTFKSFLCKYHVVIPMVQRDYAQGRTSIEVNRVRNRFLTAIKNYLLQPDSNYEVMKMDFVYGETENIWSKTETNKLEKIIVTPLDGQQRLTTLFLLHWYAAKKVSSIKMIMLFWNISLTIFVPAQGISVFTYWLLHLLSVHQSRNRL
ncbi:DUF262 domain-containing protein [Bacteroides stercoris]|nr:DUF262 domain-containing protein [Bacteroides stercoris]